MDFSFTNDMKEVILKTRDGVNIIAHLFQPDKSNGKLVLINSATGVKQQVYFAIAQYFAENSFTVITYDYRGIGLSKPLDMRNFNSDAVLWGKEDFGIITAYIKENFSDYQKYCLGHSVGALILGMNADSEIFEKFILLEPRMHTLEISNGRPELSLSGVWTCTTFNYKIIRLFSGTMVWAGRKSAKRKCFRLEEINSE